MNTGSIYLRKVSELFELDVEKRKLHIKRKHLQLFNSSYVQGSRILFASKKELTLSSTSANGK